MVLWWPSSSFYDSQWCFSWRPACFVICNGAVVTLLLGISNGAVVSVFSFCELQWCFGKLPVRFGIPNGAVVIVLAVFEFALVL